MKLFDKKYVHFMWTNELKGKKGFVSQNIESLIHIVNMNNKTALKPLSKNLVNTWTFVYYDPNYDCKVAYAEGKQIQYLNDLSSEWVNVIGEPLWSDNVEYRIKPGEDLNKYDIVRFIGESNFPMAPKTGEIAIVRSFAKTDATTLLSVEWKEGNTGKKLAWFDINEFELVKKFEW